MKLFILAGTHDKFTEDEFKCLKVSYNLESSKSRDFFNFCLKKKFALQDYVENGGSVMILLGEGGETEFNTNLNFLLEDFGMSINNGLFHPIQLISIWQVRGFLRINSIPNEFQMQQYELTTTNIFIRKNV